MFNKTVYVERRKNRIGARRVVGPTAGILINSMISAYFFILFL